MNKAIKVLLISVTLPLAACTTDKNAYIVDVPPHKSDAKSRIEDFKASINEESIFTISVFLDGVPVNATNADLFKAELNGLLVNGEFGDVSNFVRTDAVYRQVDLDELDDIITINSNNKDKFLNIEYGEYAYKKYNTNKIVNGKRILSVEMLFRKNSIFNGSLYYITPVYTIEREDGSIYKLTSLNINRQNYFLKTSVLREEFDGPITETSGHMSCTDASFYGVLDPAQYDDSCNAVIKELQYKYSEFSEKFGLMCNILNQQGDLTPLFSSGTYNSNSKESFNLYSSYTIKAKDSLTGLFYDVRVNLNEITYTYNEGDNFVSDVTLHGSYNDGRSTDSEYNMDFTTKCNSAN
ncbi:MAG TPA: hypothetical protein DCL21_00935 [Alphaproteobacteria bacterium]|nr:hypothetical protein [Alphaproteobacteria bacterium]